MKDERHCKKHEGGQHCWHDVGHSGFSGKYESTVPVQCCHCLVRAEQRRHGADWIDYNAVSEEEK